MVTVLSTAILLLALFDLHVCQRKTSRNVAVGADVKAVINFDCPEEFGYYPHPSDCTQYYVCVFGGALLESCTGGLMYSHELQTCDWPRNVGCDSGEVSAPSTTASTGPPPRAREEARTRYTPPTPHPPQPAAIVTSRGQPRQLHHNQQEIIKQRQQQQLYEEAEETLPPAEEIESDRQQRVYRGQPSTVGQVQRDRDGLRHSNAIPNYNARNGKIGVISFGTQQQPQHQQYSYLTLKRRRKRQIQIQRSRHHVANSWRKPTKASYTPFTLLPPPIQTHNAFSTTYQSSSTNDNFKPIVPQQPERNPYRTHTIANKEPFTNPRKSNFFKNFATSTSPTNDYQDSYSYFNIGSISTYRPQINPKTHATNNYNHYHNQMVPQHSHLNNQNVTLVQVSTLNPLSSSVTEAIYDDNTGENYRNGGEEKEAQEVDSESSVNSESDDESDGSGNTSNEEFGPLKEFNYDYFRPPPSYFNPKNKYEDVPNPFASPDFDFDKFLVNLRGPPSVQVTTSAPTQLPVSRPSRKQLPQNNEYYYYYYDDADNTSPKQKPKNIYSSQIKPSPTVKHKQAPKVADDYYYEYDYPEKQKPTVPSGNKHVQYENQAKKPALLNTTRSTTMKFSSKYQEKPTKASLEDHIDRYKYVLSTTTTPPVKEVAGHTIRQYYVDHQTRPQKYHTLTTETPASLEVLGEFPKQHGANSDRYKLALPTTATAPLKEISGTKKLLDSVVPKATHKTRPQTIRQRTSRKPIVTPSTTFTTTATITATTRPSVVRQRHRLTNTTQDIQTIDDDDLRYRIEQSSITPIQAPISTATATARTLYNSTQYNGNSYDPYYALYEDDVELYRDVDYPQQYNNNNNNNNQQNQVPRRTPAPIIQQATVQEEVPPKRGNTAYIPNTYQSQDLYQPSTVSDYAEDNNYNTQEEDQNAYRQVNRQPSRVPVTAKENNTQAQSIINSFRENPGENPSTTSTDPLTFDSRPDATVTYRPNKTPAPLRPAVVNSPTPFTLPRHLTEKPSVFHYITKSPRSTTLVSTEAISEGSQQTQRVIVPTTYSPPKFFLKSLLPKPLNGFSISNADLPANATKTENKPYKTLKSIRKLISPVLVNYGLYSVTESSFESAEKLASEEVDTFPSISPDINKSDNGNIRPPLMTPLAVFSTTLTAPFNTATKEFTSLLGGELPHSPLKSQNASLPKFRTTVEVPPPKILGRIQEKQEADPHPNEAEFKPFPTSFETTTKTDAPTNNSNTIPVRVSRVNTAIKSMIAFGATRRQKCQEGQSANQKCSNDPKLRTNTRGRGSAHYASAGNIINNEVSVTVNRGTPAPRSRPTLKPSTSIVSKASEFIDIYRFPPIRPEAIYPQPQPDKTAAKCRKDVCLLPDCNCGGKEIPGDLPVEQVPQIVLLTFDDSVNDLNKGLYSDLFEKGRANPNGCPIAATFYVSHEWTDYSQVQNLYSDGHEIASHTVSHSFGEQFSQKKWTREVSGQREILSAYGGVRLEDVRGMRAPFLSVGGNKMFKMLYDSNFTYDSSMPIYENKPPSWPYTLDYKLFHDCMIPPCPTRSYPGVWEVPMVMWQDLNGGRCSMGDACSNPPDADGVFKMLTKNFQRHYTTNRAPFGLFYHAAWFTQPHHKEGFINFMDSILQMKDVWLLTNWQAIQWVRDPTPTSRLGSFQPFQCDFSNRPKRCNNPKVCNLWHKSGVRYMRTCQPCPDIYPWTGNTGIRSSRIDNDIED